MDVYLDQIVSVGLNALGFLAAGLLWTVLFSRRRVPTVRAMPDPDRAVPSEEADNAPTSSRRRTEKRVEFLDLGAAHTSSPTDEAATTKTAVGSARRNRAEVLALAREMLRDGRSHEQIRQSLPIAEGELSLLNQTSNA